MVHPHENKKIYQEASLAKQESRDTSSTKKCKYVGGARAGYREEKNKHCQGTQRQSKGSQNSTGLQEVSGAVDAFATTSVTKGRPLQDGVGDSVTADMDKAGPHHPA